MARGIGLGAAGICLVATLACADDMLLDLPLYPHPSAVIVVDAKAKTTVGALEIIPPCYARQIDGKRLEVMTTRGWGWVDRDKMMTPTEAEAYCKSHATEAYALFVRATLRLAQEKDDQALADLNQALQKDPKLAAAYCSRGNLFALQGDNGRALADFKAAVKAAPKDLLAANELAWFLATCPEAKFRDGKLARAEATRVCEATGYQHEEFLDTLAAACAESGDFAAALKWVKKAAELDPQNEDFATHTKLFQASKPLREELK